MANESSTPPDSIRVLLFENSSKDAETLASHLERSESEYQISRAKNLGEGLGTIQKEHFDLILLNLSLPDSKGIATLTAVQDEAKDAIILILAEPQDVALSYEALRAGAQDFLNKSGLNGEVLRRSMRHAIERARLGRKLERHTTEIEHSEALLRSIFDAITDAMLILTPSYEIKFFNPAAAALLDSDENTLIGEIFPFEVSTAQLTELEIPDTSGGFALIELSAVDLVWKGEKALLVMLRDITPRRTAELELKREKELLSITLDSISEAVISTDETGVIENINQEASRLIQITEENSIGKALPEVLRLKIPDSKKLIEDPEKHLLESGHEEGFNARDLLLERKNDETPLFVNAEMRSILDEDGRHRGSVAILRDITRKQKTEEELLKEEKLNSISLLASGIAHDFNNMLTAILGNVSVVRMETEQDGKQSKKLLAAETAALQAKSLTQQLLAFSKGEAPSFEVTTIDQIVEESAQFILRGSNVKCEIEKEDGIWPVDADRGQINQVVNNLIINADQAMPSGGTVTIKLTNCRLKNREAADLKAGQYICIEVNDEGVGIEPENLKRVFDPYFTTKDDGNGLGLASSQSVIKRHNGAMTVDSKPGEGSSFRIYLPKTDKVLPPQERVEEKPAKSDDGKIHRGSGRILVMDDMEAMMTVAGEILTTLGYEVEYSTNGEEAIEAYKKAKESGNPFDAVVFDLTVPGGMGGEEASNILIEYDPDLIAIASSGYSNSSVMSDHKNSAFKAVVPKPYRIKEISDTLHGLLHSRT